MMYRLICIGLLMLVCGCVRSAKKFNSLPTVFNRGTYVEAKGFATLEDGDILSARKVALEEAKKAAIEKVIGVFISAKTEVNLSVLQTQNIFSNTSGYVGDYKILSEKKIVDGLYVVHAKIEVLTQKISNTIPQQVKHGMDMKKIWLNIRVNFDQKNKYKEYVYQKITHLLQKIQNFVITDEALNADISFVCEITIRDLPIDAKWELVAMMSHASLQILDADDQAIFVMDTEQKGVAKNGEQAILKSLKSVAKQIVTDVKNPIQKYYRAHQDVMIWKIKNVESFQFILRVQDILKREPIIKDFKLLFFKDNIAKFNIFFHPNQDVLSLQDKMVRLMTQHQELNLVVIEKQKNKIIFHRDITP